MKPSETTTFAQRPITGFSLRQFMLITLLIMGICPVMAQKSIPFTSTDWEFGTNDYAREDFQGKQALRLKNNSALLANADFENGILEYDMSFPQHRAFVGIIFRMEDEANHEIFYIRAHQSGNPDANQYTPVYNTNAGWQLYYGERYATPIQYEFSTWIHVKLVVSGQILEVYIKDMDKPLLTTELMRKSVKGGIALQSFPNDGYFANVTITPMDNPTIKGTVKPKDKMAEGTVANWQISDAFSEKLVESIISLKEFTQKPAFKKVAAEFSGTVNISAAAKFSQDTNTVLAKLVVDSDKEQVKKFFFGFSDRARVFVNGDLLFFGADEFQTRDYRFLGTIGYYDAVFVKLKKGRNEIQIAVSENFGGWGVRGKFADMSGIKLID